MKTILNRLSRLWSRLHPTPLFVPPNRFIDEKVTWTKCELSTIRYNKFSKIYSHLFIEIYLKVNVPIQKYNMIIRNCPRLFFPWLWTEMTETFPLLWTPAGNFFVILRTTKFNLVHICSLDEILTDNFQRWCLNTTFLKCVMFEAFFNVYNRNGQ